MPSNLTLMFGTYTFPNQSFLIEDHRLTPDTPVAATPRRNGGEVLPASLMPRPIRINGKIYGLDKDSVHNSFNTMQRAMHNAGVGASLYYRADRFVYAQLSQQGMVGKYQEGLYEHVILVDMSLIAKDTYAESIERPTILGTRNNACSVSSVTPGGNYQTQGVWNVVAGTWGFTGGIEVLNLLNCMSFIFTGPMLPGQTLVIDNVLGCVLLQVGLTMTDAMTWFGGHAFLEMDPGVQNDLLICGPTMSFDMSYRPRFYS